MSMDEKLRGLSERIKNHSSSMLTEEAVETSIVLPFLNALGYDVFDPSEVIPEFTADAVGKWGEKVDYAIKIDGQIRIVVECKPITTNLGQLPATGFTVSCFPVKIEKSSAGWTRAVAILDD